MKGNCRGNEIDEEVNVDRKRVHPKKKTTDKIRMLNYYKYKKQLNKLKK